MELDKRVTELETELKIIKGEVKELLVDIRDQMNRTDNPFFRIQNQGAAELEVPKKEKPVEEKKKGESIRDEKTLGERTGKPFHAFGDRAADEVLTEKAGNKKDSATSGPSRVLGETAQEGKARQEARQETSSHEPAISCRKDIDTFLLVELMRWVDYAVRTVGHSNLEELLNLYTVTGQLSEELKEILQNIANLSTEEAAEAGRASMKDNIIVLSQLSAILNPGKSRGRIQSIYGESGWKGEKKDKKTELAFN